MARLYFVLAMRHMSSGLVELQAMKMDLTIATELDSEASQRDCKIPDCTITVSCDQLFLFWPTRRPDHREDCGDDGAGKVEPDVNDFCELRCFLPLHEPVLCGKHDEIWWIGLWLFNWQAGWQGSWGRVVSI